MTFAADFLLKVIFCSALLTGFYWIALRNKLFHQWNRFYLLGAVLVSILIPFIKITFAQTEETPKATYQAIQAVTTDEIWIEPSVNVQAASTPFFTKETVMMIVYISASVILLAAFVIALIKIYRLIKTNRNWKLEGLTFVDTNAKGTPFSFFRYLFWNDAIDFYSREGQQIFTHELIHVKEKHSTDKLFMQIVLIIFWINPFFWLIRKELAMIHEFIADQKSVKDHDASYFAEMILASVFPSSKILLTNSFFYSPIKRRLLMLTKLQNSKVNYISRLLLLPLLAVIFFAFVLKTKDHTTAGAIANLEQEVTVVIDAGHGYKNGSPDGARGVNGISEDEISLAITKKIEALNTDKNLKLIFTRLGKDFVGLHERADFAITNKADLFVSIHANFSPMLKEGNKYVENPNNGFEMFVARDEFPFVAESKELASNIANEMQGIIAVREPAIKQRKQGIWVLQNNNCPSVLLECGFVSNAKDAAFLADENNQQKMAEAILRGIKNYVANKNNTISDTVSLPVSQSPSVTTTENNQTSVRKEKNLLIIYGTNIKESGFTGKIISSDKLTVIKPNDKAAIAKYGPEAKKGVMIFENAVIATYPAKDTIPSSTDENMIFTKVEIEPEFPGGETQWIKYMKKRIEENLEQLKKDNKSGTCEVQFIVDIQGSVSNISALTMKESKLASVVIDAIKKGPKWIPAKQNGHHVSSWRRQKVTFRMPDEKPAATTSTNFTKPLSPTFTKEGVSANLLEEYNLIVSKYKKNEAEWWKDFREKITKTDKNRLAYIFNRMSWQQQQQQSVLFVQKSVPLPEIIPTNSLLTQWKNTSKYRILINDIIVGNAELNKYSSNDFLQYTTITSSKEVIKSGKPYVTVYLMTTDYYRNYRKQALQNNDKYDILLVIGK